MTELLDLVGLPKTLQNSLLNHLASEFGLNTYSQGTARDGGHGCNNDGFAVFGFLAFLLAAANLLMDDGGRSLRRKRSECTSTPPPIEIKQEGIKASYSLFRGFLNALDAADNKCSNYFWCEGASQAARTGATGQVLAKVASSNADSWLQQIAEDLHNGTKEAGIMGAGLEQPCDTLFHCAYYPPSYR